MKKINLLVIFILLLLLTSCIFFPNDGKVKFKEEISHKLLWQKTYSTEYSATGASFYHFDGQYFYFGLKDNETNSCGIVKYDLNENNVWGKMVNLTQISNNSDVQEVESIAKIDNKLYICTIKTISYQSFRHNLIVLNADTGEYYGIYNLVQNSASGASHYKVDSCNNIVYVVLNIVDEGLHIYCFDRNSNAPVLIKERFFANIKAALTASKFIYDGKIYFRGLMDEKERQLIVMDAGFVADENKTNEECITKVIDGESETGCSNIIIQNNKLITGLNKEIKPNEVYEGYFYCYDILNNYNYLWHSKLYRAPTWIDTQKNDTYFFIPAMNMYVNCYSMTDVHLVWENDNSIYVNDTESNWNNVSTGAIIENKWYAQSVYSGSCVIIYDINSGKKVGRIENQSFSILTKETCWAVGNKLYVLTDGGYFNCYEIEGKSKNENIIIIFFILFTGSIVIYVEENNKRKKKKVKEKIFNSIVAEIGGI